MTYRLRHGTDGSPVLETARLCLRRSNEGDFGPLGHFWASDRSVMMGGPWDAATLRVELDDLQAQWDRHGFSLFTITRKGDDQGIGSAGPFYPQSHPEPEMSWSLWNRNNEGQGLATEAAIAARDWFFAETDYATAVSYTHPDNAASHRVCLRLGAVDDPTAPCPYAPPVRIFRHARVMLKAGRA